MQTANEVLAVAPGPVARALMMGASVAGLVRDPGKVPQAERVMVIPVWGVLTPYSNDYGTATVQLGADVKHAAESKHADKIVMVFNSPGGFLPGVEEAAQIIRAARTVKPIVAVVQFLAGSAAYYLAAQASAIVAAPTAELGSIGVVLPYAESSRALAEMGVAVTVFRKPAKKAELSGLEPLTPEAREYVERVLGHYYGMFASAVAAGRRVPVERVTSPLWGEGRLMVAADAVRLGLADRIGTLDDVLTKPANVTAAPVALAPGAQARDGARLALKYRY